MRNTLTASLATALLASAASADTINARFVGVEPGQNVTVRYFGDNMNTRAGGFNFIRDVSNPGTLPGFDPGFIGFCIDLSEFVRNGDTYAFNTYSLADAPTSEAGPMGAARAQRLARLFGSHYSGLATAANQAQAYAAFQLAVWEIVTEDGLNLSSGSFKVTSAPEGTKSLAQSWVDSVLIPGPTMNLFAIDNAADDCPGHQGYVMVPTPGAAAALGLGGLAAMRRRRAR